MWAVAPDREAVNHDAVATPLPDGFSGDNDGDNTALRGNATAPQKVCAQSFIKLAAIGGAAQPAICAIPFDGECLRGFLPVKAKPCIAREQRSALLALEEKCIGGRNGNQARIT